MKKVTMMIDCIREDIPQTIDKEMAFCVKHRARLHMPTQKVEIRMMLISFVFPIKCTAIFAPMTDSKPMMIKYGAILLSGIPNVVLKIHIRLGRTRR
ncbi:hypothetical protein, partial [Salmonella enterica]|uniref:hypothetical protein n=1 Tax=Salmonella enterica TaxID=28901 RepID=UPI0021B4B81D